MEGQSEPKNSAEILRSLVVYGNERTSDIGDILRIVRAEAQKREHTHENINVKTIIYVGECGCYVALYKIPGVREGKVMNQK